MRTFKPLPSRKRCASLFEPVKNKRTKCKHILFEIHTEPDGCFWISCNHCNVTGPAKHSRFAAMIAFALKLLDEREPPCHKLPKSQWCDRKGLGDFMGHTCG